MHFMRGEAGSGGVAPPSSAQEECRRDAVKWAAELVRIASENPPGREIQAAEYCAERMRGLRLDVALDEFEPGRANVTAYYGDRDNLGIVFNGHLDVVAAREAGNIRRTLEPWQTGFCGGGDRLT